MDSGSIDQMILSLISGCMYMNAFRSNQTTYFREGGGSPGNTDSELGWIEIRSFTGKIILT
jgi:hypothetical protein